MKTENFSFEVSCFTCHAAPGWTFERNADDKSWEAWNPEREFRICLDDDVSFSLFEAEGESLGIPTIPFVVVAALRELTKEKP